MTFWAALREAFLEFLVGHNQLEAWRSERKAREECDRHMRSLTLQAVADLQPNAYGVTLQDRTGIPVVTLYSVLEQLEEEYLVGSQKKPGGPERGGRPKLLWSITPSGRRALQA